MSENGCNCSFTSETLYFYVKYTLIAYPGMLQINLKIMLLEILWNVYKVVFSKDILDNRYFIYISKIKINVNLTFLLNKTFINR